MLTAMLILPLLMACTGTESPTTTTDEPAPTPAPKPPVRAPKHALVILIDTLRADALAEATTPNIDAIAAKGDAVAHAWSAGTWTVPSVVSIFTGMPVRQHGWDLPTGRLGHYPKLPVVPTLASVLHDAGYGTFGLYSNPYLAEELGFDRGFDTWRRSSDTAMAKRLAEEVGGWDDGRGHFAYVHLLGPHSPLRPSPEAQERWSVSSTWIDEKKGFGIGAAKRGKEEGVREAYAAAYRAVIEDTDILVGDIITALGAQREDTLVLLTSDHGELLGEHSRVGHGTWLYQGLTHVPLMVDRGTLPETLGIASVPALVTGALGVEHPWATAADAALPLTAQREGNVALSPDGQHKGVWTDGSLAVYDLTALPLEDTSLTDNHGLPEARTAWEAGVPAGTLSEDGVTLHPDTIAELKALGYLE
jgi:hypothetical protein